MVTINIGRKELIIFGVVILIFAVAGIGIAYNSGLAPDVMGHSLSELEVPAGCSSGNILKYDGSSWSCGVDNTGGASGGSQGFLGSAAGQSYTSGGTYQVIALPVTTSGGSVILNADAYLYENEEAGCSQDVDVIMKIYRGATLIGTGIDLVDHLVIEDSNPGTNPIYNLKITVANTGCLDSAGYTKATLQATTTQ